jgi:hypothetical protein
MELGSRFGTNGRCDFADLMAKFTACLDSKVHHLFVLKTFVLNFLTGVPGCVFFPVQILMLDRIQHRSRFGSLLERIDGK